MKISIVTVVLNAENTIADTLQSIDAQTHQDIEHIIVDGRSSDRTLSIIEQYPRPGRRVISEADKGLYDAMNKGIALATGEVIGILNADDVLQDETVLAQINDAMCDADLDGCYADLVYVRANQLDQVVRRWKSQEYSPGLSFKGWMPAHPTFYLRRSVWQKIGEFDTELRFQADLEFCARAFELHRIRTRYIPRLWVRMRLGGVTNNSWQNMLRGNWESYLALRKLGLRRDPISFFAIKFSSRLKQYF